MNDTGKDIGTVFKDRRKEMNISLKEAENATSIRMSYLQSIEDSDMSKLISPVYAQGFVKQYAAFLGLDGEKLIKEHHDLFSRLKDQEFSYGIGTLEMRGNPSAGIKWFPNILWAAALLLIFTITYFFAKYMQVL